MNLLSHQSLEAKHRETIHVIPIRRKAQSMSSSHIFQYGYPRYVHEMTRFTCDENDELLGRIQDLAEQRRVFSVDRLGPLVKNAPAVGVECPPLKTAAEAIVLNDTFALFLSSGESGYVIAASGGFRVGDDREYHVVGAGNTGNEGVFRPSDELCAALASACTNFISGSKRPPEPGDMSEVLVAALDICRTEVVRRLDIISIAATTFPTSSAANIHMLSETGLQPYRNFFSQMAVLRDCLESWGGLGSEEKTTVATLYGLFLKVTSEVWNGIKDLVPTNLELHEVYICGLNSIAKGLRLLRSFPRGTRVVFDWPQGSTNGDRFKIQDYRGGNAPLYTDCQLHCEIYLALHILFADSNVRFHPFLVEEGMRVFTIGCSKPSCLPCWDILLELSTRTDLPDHPIHSCRTGNPNGRCYKTWGLTPHTDTLPLSLTKAITPANKAEMLESLHRALKRTLHKFRSRAGHQSNFGHFLGPAAFWPI